MSDYDFAASAVNASADQSRRIGEEVGQPLEIDGRKGKDILLTGTGIVPGRLSALRSADRIVITGEPICG